MTLVPMKKRCPNYGKMYTWNPDVGMWRCPRCVSSGNEMLGKFVVLKQPDTQKQGAPTSDCGITGKRSKAAKARIRRIKNVYRIYR